MKPLKIVFNLFIALILGMLFSSFADTHVMAASVDVMPFVYAAPIFAASFIHLPAGAFYLAPYVDIDVAKTGTNPGKGGDKKDLVIVFNWDDVTGGYTRDDKGVVLTTNLTFKAGAYMSKIYATQSTIKAGDDSGGDPDAESVTQTVDFSHPGDAVAINEFKANWMSRNIGIIVQKCSSSRKRLFGAPCAPLRISWKGMDDEKSNTNVFTFKSALGGPCVCEYEGTMQFSTVTATVAADATTINLTTGEGQYQLTDGTAAPVEFTTCTNAVNGMVFTILGSGGTYPSTITDDHDFMPASGTTWTGIAGATITFKAFKTGVSTWKFIEQSRT